jgi:hypothetical protein
LNIRESSALYALWSALTLLGSSGDNLDEAPALGLAHRAALPDANQVANGGLIAFIVSDGLRRPGNLTAIQAVRRARLDRDNPGLFTSSFDHSAFDQSAAKAIVLCH